jgi:CRISPR-associated endonuclease/helicase Cas3
MSALAEPDRELAARLIGTSHGHGRHGFPHTGGHLIDHPDQIAVTLFDEGLWDELIERTHLRWGVWGCAYLEALLRAADGQVSAEGL